tara:strand:+ start:1137 stop:2243 length:1107 start_codon:yes stop_codon:yes gene_type:complete
MINLRRDEAENSAAQPMVLIDNTEAKDVTADLPALSEHARAVIRDSLSDNTLENYKRWWDRFVQFGGTLPATETQIIEYLVRFGDAKEEDKDNVIGEGKTRKKVSCSSSTLDRWTVAINFVHSINGHGRPCNTDEVRRALKGIKNRQAAKGKTEKRASALLLAGLNKVIACMGETPTDVRDRAILMIGFACALRRSEIAAMKASHLKFTPEGVTVTIPKSKTDQQGAGHEIGINYGRKAGTCPVATLQEWIEELGAAPGEDTVIFRRIDRWGSILPPKEKKTKGAVIQQGLTPRSIGNIIQSRCAKAGYKATEYSGHSLRAGLCTQAAKDGKPNWQIKKTSRHSGDEMLGRYVRDGQLYKDTATDGMF